MLCCALGAAEPSAQAILAGVRCLFPSPHDESRHRLVLRVDIVPDTPGWSVSAATQARRIKGRDAAGNVLTSELGSWENCPENAEACTAYFSFLLQSRTAWVDVDEKLHVQLAENKATMSLGEVSMLEPSARTVGSVTFGLEPDAANAEESNREQDGTLRRAGLKLVYPEQLHLLSVCRVWKGERDEEMGTEMPPYAQELEMVHAPAAEGMRSTHVELWNAVRGEELEVTVCMTFGTVEVPVRFRAMLGDPAPPALRREMVQAAADP